MKRNFLKKRNPPLHPDAPLLNLGHGKPVSRRDMLGRGLLTGAAFGSVGMFGLFSNPRDAMAALSGDLEGMKTDCGIAAAGAGKIPFICFDLAGGANIAGSNVLVGGQGGQQDLLSSAGYSKLGLPGNMAPNNDPTTINTDLGLAFHSDSPFLLGILDKAPNATANTNGCVIPARSENDTANNPHNPMYGIFNAGADGELLSLIGSRSSMSGGNSMSPDASIIASARPTKVDRRSDVTGLVDTGKLVGLLDQADAVSVMESIARISHKRIDRIDSGLTDTNRRDNLRNLLRCGYVEAADITDRYGDPSTLDIRQDMDILGIFSDAELNDREFEKTASVMKLVVNGYAGAGCISMGGFDYHTGERGTGEIRDRRAGRCMGACLEYARRKGVPLMIYVFSDGSVASNGRIDDSAEGRGKGEWTGDNSSTAASFFLVYDPNGRPTLNTTGGTAEQHQQLGWMRPDASVETAGTPAANNVNLLAETVWLNYMALHGEQDLFSEKFPNHSLGNSDSMDRLTAFEPIVSGTIT
ncbi:general secretion pathway protein GspF [uncultured Alcanivorax sp.]|uniref:general secretion pathway protein GspF n=1 Tax=uncultured Alcanivorax sp. TaxID=191215 RepID=UPI002625E5DA|nr:general secretion pathway protein GspF [uncultured Alcanivorax sp.]